MKFLRWIILFLLAVLAITVAVSNREVVTLRLDPFSDVNPAIQFELALFLVIFASVLVGLCLGAAVVWAGQWKWRRQAAREARRARDLERQVVRLERAHGPVEADLAA